MFETATSLGLMLLPILRAVSRCKLSVVLAQAESSPTTAMTYNTRFMGEAPSEKVQ
jgi:hypothetical protein